MATQAAADHPITLSVTDDLERNRLTVFFRLILAIPHFVVVTLWGLLAMGILMPISWLVTLFVGRLPDGLHNLQASYLRYANRVSAYTHLTADPYPPFGASGGYPIDLEVAPPEKQNRLVTFFRGILAIPVLIFAGILQWLMNLLAIFSWFVALVTGRVPQGMRDLNAWTHRFIGQTRGYLLFLTPRYPSLGGGPTA
jgi:hypothetical protein